MFELDATTGAPVHVLNGPSYGFKLPSAVASDCRHVWVANYDGNSVTELNAATGAPFRVLTGPSYEYGGPTVTACVLTGILAAA